jgi:hypothetical protein
MMASLSGADDRGQIDGFLSLLGIPGRISREPESEQLEDEIRKVKRSVGRPHQRDIWPRSLSFKSAKVMAAGSQDLGCRRSAHLGEPETSRQTAFVCSNSRVAAIRSARVRFERRESVGQWHGFAPP